MFNINGTKGAVVDTVIIIALATSLVGVGKTLKAVEVLEAKDVEQVDKDVIHEKFKSLEEKVNLGRDATKELTTAINDAQLQRGEMAVNLKWIQSMMEQKYGTLKVSNEIVE